VDADRLRYHSHLGERGVAFALFFGDLQSVPRELSEATDAGWCGAAERAAATRRPRVESRCVRAQNARTERSAARAFADQDPERAKLLLRESSQLRDSLGYESWPELTQSVLIGARLGDWPHTLTVAPPSIRHLHWTGDRPLLGAVFNVVGRAIAPTDPEAAAVLQGAARRLVTAGLEPSASTASVPTSSSNADYVTDMRQATTGLLVDALGDTRLHELRAEGDAMDTDHAVAYALDAIARAAAVTSPAS
jgi:hypothetical protein